MPAMHSDDDYPATRRDLAQLREVTEANVRADIAEVKGSIAELRATMAAGFARMDSKIANQTRVLIALNVLISGAIVAAMRATP